MSSFSSYIPVSVDTDPTDLAGDAFDYLAAQVPGWTPSDGNLEAWLVEALAQIAGELAALAALVPESIFAYYGETILGLPPYPAVQATALTTWTAVDANGYLIDAGTVIAVTPPASNQGYAFALSEQLVIPGGQTTVASVPCLALQAGSEASGLTGTVEVIDQLTFIESVTLDVPTSGGQDAETTDAYLSRLSALLTLLTPRPILPQDFAVLAQRSVEGVGRAVAIDLYNPGPPIDANCPRCVTVALCDTDGNACPPTVHAEVDALLQAQREVNFLVFVVDPTYTKIDVTFDAVAWPKYDPADVQARAIAAVEAYLSPAAWGVPNYGDTSGQSWVNVNEVRYLEISTVLNNVDGVNYLNTLAIGPHGGAMGQANVALPGVAPMAQAGTVTGTVEAG